MVSPVASFADTTPPVPDTSQRLAHLRNLSGLLDTRFRIPGTRIRFGYDALVGLIPGFGDLAGAAVSLYVIYLGSTLGVSKATLLRMFVNVIVEVIVGAVPVLGDLFDVGWKANVRNVELVEAALADEDREKADWQFLTWTGIGVVVVMFVLLVGLIALIAWLVSLLV